MHDASAEQARARWMRESPRASGRMLVYLDALYRFHGLDMRAHARGLRSVPVHGPVPLWIAWGDFVTLIERLGDLRGADGMARAMRSLPEDAYAEFRAAKRFFHDPLVFFFHYHTTIAPAVTAGCRLEGSLREDGRVALSVETHPSVRPGAHFMAGTVSLIELFPTHFDLPEAEVEVVSRDTTRLEAIVTFPAPDERNPWSARLDDLGAPDPLTPREREVLVLVSQGLTNQAVADRLGTALGTVRNQLSSILKKMRATNRTELATRARRPM